MGWPSYGLSSSESWSYCQYLMSRSAHVLIMPVPPTTNAHTSVTMPSRLCRSSHFTRVERSRRTSPNASLRMKGAYSTTPVTMATSSSKPMKPRNSLPGRPANRSTCRRNITCMKPSSNRGCASTCAVRASTATERKSSVGAGVGVRVTNHTLSSSSAGDANCTTRSGCSACAVASTWSRLARGVSAGMAGASTSVPSRWPISW